jgi:phospholipid/cholesterol/gamma-HCH transport system permease protein
MRNPIRTIGAEAIAIIRLLGRMMIFLVGAVASAFAPPFRVRNIVRQVHFIGMRSLFVIVLVAVFTGMVLALQGYHTLRQVGSESLLGTVVALSLIRELGPVLSALMVTGRAGSALAAEIGIMRIGEQIDSLKVMGVDPLKYLISPRILGGVISLPLLTGIFDVVGIFGGYLVGVRLLGVNAGAYFGRMRTSVMMEDITNGFIKSIAFGVIIAWVCTYKGYFTERGAEGVSRATTSAVVLSSVLILAGDYVLTSVLL